jgi:hypothetical protein
MMMTRSMRIPPALATLLLALTLAAPPPARAADPIASLTISPDLVLGGPETEDEYILDGISSVADDSRGNIYVMDTRAPALHKFAPDGALLATLTAVGEGPGDLTRMPFIAVDAQDRIHVAGMGGRVQVLTPELRHAATYERAHPARIARSLAILPDGRLAVTAIDPERHTTIHLHDAKGAHLRSFCESFAAGRDLPHHMEDTYGGGLVAPAADGRLLYAQMTPYLVRILDLEGHVLRQTDAGGADFVPEPEVPEVKDGRTRMRFRGMTSGIVPLPGGRILVSAMQRDDAGAPRSLLCLYDAELKLLARHEADGLTSVVGHGAGGRIYLHEAGEEGTRVRRARVAPGPPSR